MEVLLERGHERFVLDKKFDFKYLSPIGYYVQWKLESNNWDDYNELYHATKLIEHLKKDANLWFDTHALIRNDSILGVLLIVGGKIKSLENKYPIEKEDQSLLLKYFHIIEKGKGHGSFWINDVVIPYYREKGYKHIYVNSSHQASFPFYKRLGSFITSYVQMSDHYLHEREGNCFSISL